MSNDLPTYAGPYPTPESQGIDKAYEAVRETAEKELADSIPGPRVPLEQVSGEGIKNPEGEFAIPSPRLLNETREERGLGPNQVGNSSGKGPVDPQGQQGGTQGGQPGSPSLGMRDRKEGTPLKSAEERQQQPLQEKDGTLDKPS